MKTKSEMRVNIAKDVIAQIKAKKITPLSGAYLCIDREEKTCEACALGSMFMTHVAKMNPLDVIFGDICEVDDDEMRKQLSKFFSEDELWEIENAFERDGMSPEGCSYLDEDDDERRLLLIMRNIIKNNGKFVATRSGHREYNKYDG